MIKERLTLNVFTLVLPVTLFFFSLPCRPQEYVRISPPDSAFEADPSRSGDGSKIVWNIIGKGLYIINIDGTSMRYLTFGGDPAWCPTEDKIAYLDGYVRNDTMYTAIKLINSDGTGNRTVFEESFYPWDPDSGIWAPAWLPDGNKLIFSMHGDIYTIDTSGTNLTRLTSDTEYENYPCCSPDGTKIIYTKGVNIGVPGSSGEAHLWMMDRNGENQHFFLSKGRGELVFQDGWSPDGTKIVYSVWYPNGVDTLSEVWVVNSDGTFNRRVTDGSLYKEDAAPNQNCVWAVDPIWLDENTVAMGVVPIKWINPGPPPEFKDDYYNGGIFAVTVPASGIVEHGSKIKVPDQFFLMQNYPNPFNSNTVINYRLLVGEPVSVRLNIYNLSGELIRTLVDANEKRGNYSVNWDGKDMSGRSMPSGVYFYRLNISGKFRKTNRMVLLK